MEGDNPLQDDDTMDLETNEDCSLYDTPVDKLGDKELYLSTIRAHAVDAHVVLCLKWGSLARCTSYSTCLFLGGVLVFDY